MLRVPALLSPARTTLTWCCRDSCIFSSSTPTSAACGFVPETPSEVLLGGYRSGNWCRQCTPPGRAWARLVDHWVKRCWWWPPLGSSLAVRLPCGKALLGHAGRLAMVPSLSEVAEVWLVPLLGAAPWPDVPGWFYRLPRSLGDRWILDYDGSSLLKVPCFRRYSRWASSHRGQATRVVLRLPQLKQPPGGGSNLTRGTGRRPPNSIPRAGQSWRSR